MQSIASQQWNQDTVDTTFNSAESETILDKVISLLGGSMSSQHYQQNGQHDQDISLKMQNNLNFNENYLSSVFLKNDSRRINELAVSYKAPV